MSKSSRMIWTTCLLFSAGIETARAESPCIQSYQESSNNLEATLQQAHQVADSTEVVRRILDAVGGFRIKVFAVAGLGNACAARPNGERIIYYDDAWLRAYSKNSYWVTVGVLAHEVGHLMNEHRRDDGLNAWHKEFEADSFVGRVVSILGGSLENAKEAVTSQPQDASRDYPPRAWRLSAVEQGFNRTKAANLKSPESDARYQICTLPIFGQSGWQKEENLSGTSGWRNGGYNQNAYCSDFKNSIVNSRKLTGTVYELEKTDSSEEDRDTGFMNTGPHQYNYHCTVKLSSVPLYYERADERCGLLPESSANRAQPR